MNHFAPRPTKSTKTITVVSPKGFRSWLRSQKSTVKAWVSAQDFSGRQGEIAKIYSGDKKVKAVVVGVEPDGSPFPYAHLPAALGSGRWAFDKSLEDEAANDAALGWALGTYVFDRYKKSSAKFGTLVWPEAADQAKVERLAASTAYARDLVTTPAGDLGPTALADSAKALAKEFGAKCTVIVGDKLLAENYPAVHAVGRACTDAPRLIDIVWGDAAAPKVTLVGKGVCFDTGGLDIKPSSGMLLMKKDMGGAAMVLAIARAVMDAKLNVRLRVLVPAVENSVAGNAFHPQDVLQTRKGLTVEVGNTDAEGRLILCDALAEADSEKPDLILDFATLTGAARVALGTDVPALFSNDDELANELVAAGQRTGDLLWRMPLHQPYKRSLDSSIADINNVGGSRYGGAITAALFLESFVSSSTAWAHVDLMAYNLENRPGRPIGGEAMGVRAAYAMLEARYGA